MIKLLLILLQTAFGLSLNAQSDGCIFKPPFITIHFGSGMVQDLNTVVPPNYGRVLSACPTDGHYAYIPSTSNCFRGDWFDLAEDHTPGDRAGNMMVVNASYDSGPFLNTTVSGFKGGVIYRFNVWMMNLCRITDKCPYPLLPDITIQLLAPDGKLVAQFNTGELQRLPSPRWINEEATFTMPKAITSVRLMMIDNAPGGCGNDFALDDITFRECEKLTPAPVVKSRLTSGKKQPREKTPAVVNRKKPQVFTPATPQPKLTPLPTPNQATARQSTVSYPPPPPLLTTRANPLVKQLYVDPGTITIDVYDNGEIDGDTITVYHNNELVVSHAGLSAKPITFHIAVDAAHPHHELVMVADNLGSIPPNTSLMIVKAGDKRYEVFISSTEQKNAKVTIDLQQ